MTEEHYIIATGQRGRDRLKVLTRVFTETTDRFLDRLGIAAGMTCLDVGCGGGDIATDLARRVGQTGRVVAIDLDAAALDIARAEEDEQQLSNIDYRLLDIFDLDAAEQFDVVYARFLLSHVTDPAAALARMVPALRPGGVVAVEDVEFAGHFCFPDCLPFDEYVRLYAAVARKKGDDPDIGPRLPSLLAAAGLRDVDMRVVQPAGIRGEVKLLSEITMEMISDAVVGAGLADPQETARIAKGLMAAARDEETLLSTPRVVQAWGRKP